jgi:hypothetical protein
MCHPRRCGRSSRAIGYFWKAVRGNSRIGFVSASARLSAGWGGIVHQHFGGHAHVPIDDDREARILRIRRTRMSNPDQDRFNELKARIAATRQCGQRHASSVCAGAGKGRRLCAARARLGEELDARKTKLSDQMVSAWTNFANTGNPNGSGNRPWPKFTADDSAQYY